MNLFVIVSMLMMGHHLLAITHQTITQAMKRITQTSCIHIIYYLHTFGDDILIFDETFNSCCSAIRRLRLMDGILDFFVFDFSLLVRLQIFSRLSHGANGWICCRLALHIRLIL